MNRLKTMLIIFLFNWAFVSCGQEKTKQPGDHSKPQKEIKYTKVISDSTNKLSGHIENLEINYHIIGCACPNWIRTADDEKDDTTKKITDLYFYIEPAENSLELPIYFDPGRHSLKIEGQFYQREDYPQGTIEMEEPMPKAKVFRYTKMEIVDKANFKPGSKIETLTLIYNAISCTCAQWSETRLIKEANKKVRYWLEPANQKLIIADTLFNGEDLPVIIKVTGQVVSENGFPKRQNLSKVGQDEAGKVFRYTKIEVIQNGEKKQGK